MKRTMIVGTTDEALIHPPEILKEIIPKRHRAEANVLARRTDFVESACPGCTSEEREFAFERSGFPFHSCRACQTLYMSPRPTLELLTEYYQQSEYGLFLRSEAYQSRSTAFQQALVRKRADKLIMLLQKGENRHHGILLHASKDALLESALTASGIAPLHSMTAPWQSRLSIAGTAGQYGVISAFDIFERVPDPGTELASIAQYLLKEGHIVLSVRSGSGYDLLTLWQHADLCPVEHMNLLTVEGMQSLMKRAGFEISELSTPGQLDLQIVKRVRQEKSLKLDRFTEYFLENRTDFACEQFQSFLQKSLLSSHMLVVGVKN